MGLFDKKQCELCGDNVNLLTRKKLSDGFLCGDCKKKLSDYSSGWSKKTVADVKKHLADREQDKEKYGQFQQSISGGPRGELMVDDTHQWFYFALGSDYREGNPALFEFRQLSGFYIEQSYDISSTNDSDGDGIPDNQDTYDNESGRANPNSFVNPMSGSAMNMVPPMLQQYMRTSGSATDSEGNPRSIGSVKAVFSLSDPYISSISFSLTDSSFDNNAYELQNAYNAAMTLVQVVEHIRGNPSPMQQGFNQNQFQQPMQQGFNQNQFQQPMQQGFNQNQFQQPMQPGFNQNQFQQPMQQGFNQNQFQQQPMQQGFNQNQFQQPMQQGFNQNQFQQQPMQQGFNQNQFQQQPMQQGFNQNQFQQQPIQQGFNQQPVQGAAMGVAAGGVAYKKFCQGCGSPNPTNSPVCQSCGASMT